ncbi:PTEN induced putative kinase 1 [Mytilus galloprovincialis]|uniref:non-specific serine/threonine protein kinase n=2 Tax=Mytilus galloprovincialis TaxID=29158 RepID=A0A8B6H2S8_MYTGA|nr:PTEN induced putative kinase 1 [Mytilus galloprovincialis]
MTAKVISNVFKRGKDVIRLALSKQPQNVEVRQPKTELFRLHTSQVIAPIRSILFTSRVSYKTIASQLRRRAAFDFGRPQRLPFFGFVGLALATSAQNENEKLTDEIKEVLQNRIKTSPIIQQLSLESFDLGQVIGKGCNAVVFEARQNDGQEVTLQLDNSSDFENVVTLQSTSVEDEEDKWYPPTELYVEEKTSQSFSVISEGEATMSSFSINEGEITDSFSFIESSEVTLSQYHFDDEISLESMSISTELTDGESENTESEEECDKWSFIEEEGIETGSTEDTTSIKYNLAIKMMFNYEVESKADSIMKAMEKETVPARVPIYQLGDSWYFRNRVRLKSLPQHPNIVDMIGAFVDPFNVPQLSVAMETYPAALPKRLYSSGLGRNMTMYIVMKNPLTDALLPLTKEQLQQLLQFTISRNPGKLLCHVFEDMDKVRNGSASINLTQGYPDPTFGLHCDEESTDQLSIRMIGRKSFFQDRDLHTNGNKTCCSLTDRDAFMSSHYLSRKEKCMKTAIELLRKGDINLSGEVFIQLAHFFFRVQDQLNTSERIFMLNIERWFSLFIASCKGPIREKMLSVALKYNRNFVEKNYTPHEGQITMRSIKLKKEITDCNDNLMNNVMGENRFGPFYEAILAHFQKSIPEALQHLYDKRVDISESTYEEPLDTMLFRFEELIHIDSNTSPGSTTNRKIGELGTVIIKKLLDLTSEMSLLHTVNNKPSPVKEIKTDCLDVDLSKVLPSIKEVPDDMLEVEDNPSTDKLIETEANIRNYQRQIIRDYITIVLHAWKCQQDKNKNCEIKHCKKIKTLLTHIKSCTDGRNCKNKECFPSKLLMEHWNSCIKTNCDLCRPLKKSVTKKNERSGHESCETCELVDGQYCHQSCTETGCVICTVMKSAALSNDQSCNDHFIQCLLEKQCSSEDCGYCTHFENLVQENSDTKYLCDNSGTCRLCSIKFKSYDHFYFHGWINTEDITNFMLQYDDTFNAAYTVLGLEGIGSDIHSEYEDLNKSIATSTRVANGNGKKRKIQGKGWKEKTSLEYRNHLVNILLASGVSSRSLAQKQYYRKLKRLKKVVKDLIFMKMMTVNRQQRDPGYQILQMMRHLREYYQRVLDHLKKWDFVNQSIILNGVFRAYELANVSGLNLGSSWNSLKYQLTRKRFKGPLWRAVAFMNANLLLKTSCVPLSLAAFLVTYGDLPSRTQADLCIKALTDSHVPLSGSTFIQFSRSQLEEYKSLMKPLFPSEYSEFHVKLAEKLLLHLDNIQDKDFIKTALYFFMDQVERFKHPEINLDNRLLLTRLIVRFISEEWVLPTDENIVAKIHKALCVLMMSSPGAPSSVNFYLLEIWFKVCKFLNSQQMAELLKTAKDAKGFVWQRSGITELVLACLGKECMQEKYYGAKLVKLFVPFKEDLVEVLDIVSSNKKSYSQASLMKMSKHALQVEKDKIFSCEISMKFLIMALESCEDNNRYLTKYKPSVTEQKYFTHFFGLITTSLTDDLIATPKFLNLLKILKRVFILSYELMMEFLSVLKQSEVEQRNMKTWFGNTVIDHYRGKFFDEVVNLPSSTSSVRYERLIGRLKDALQECERYADNVDDAKTRFKLCVINHLIYHFSRKTRFCRRLNEEF